MKRPSLAIYTTTTVDFGYKQSLLNVFGVPLQKDPDIEKVVYHNKPDMIDTTHSLIFNFQNPRNETLNIYFDTMKKIFTSLRKISSKKTKLLQLVAFNSQKGVFKKYLKAMNECGFKEIHLKKNGRVWRKVPNRSWQARLKGNIPASNEVLLLHKIK